MIPKAAKTIRTLRRAHTSDKGTATLERLSDFYQWCSQGLDMQGQGQGPSLQGPGQGQVLDLQGQGQGLDSQEQGLKFGA